MKTNKLLHQLFCLVLATVGTLLFAEGRANNLRDQERINIVQTPLESPGGPRSAVPFEAEYDDAPNYVILTCTSPCGDVSVALTSTAGDWYQTVFDTSDGVLIIPVSGESGFYTLTITTSDNTVYVGEFNL